MLRDTVFDVGGVLLIVERLESPNAQRATMSHQANNNSINSVGPVPQYIVDPNLRYDGPEFEEYCISEGKYLPASRDRTPCITCPLFNLCQPGFEEQVRRIQQGQNPSLTAGCAFSDESLSRDSLLAGLSEEQAAFVLSKLPEF